MLVIAPTDSIESGKFGTYLTGRVIKGELLYPVARLAIATLMPAHLQGVDA